MEAFRRFAEAHGNRLPRRPPVLRPAEVNRVGFTAERELAALGLTQDEVANRWGEQPSMYWDLELSDDEAFTVISVRQLQRLAAVLGTSASALRRSSHARRHAH